MDEEKIKEEYAEFQKTFPGMSNMVVLDADGKVVFSLNLDFMSEEDAESLLDVWKNQKSPLTLGGERYVVLKWDDIQFASKNVKDKTAIIGSICKSGNRCVVEYTGSGNLLQSTIDLNRWCYSRL